MRAFALIAVSASLAASACASSGAVPRPYPGARSPKVRGAAAARPSPIAASIVEAARSLLGTPYRQGGANPDGFDCSGFVQYVCARAGAQVPRSVREQWERGAAVTEGGEEPGDLLFFAIDGGEVSHVGIAIGNGEFVHAPSSRGVVRIDRVSAGYWAKRFAGARRVFGGPTSGDDRPPPADAPPVG